MSKNRQVVLQNPFHPLDLSPHDLLAIYKRFQESRQINRNLKQELPIEIVAQLISSLKGCPPSYIQKCISQALIKDTISWNQFLTFLDQQSEVRQKILEWLMYQKSAIKYRQDKEWAFRARIGKFYQEITFLKFMEINEKEKLVICSIDKVEFFLLSEMDGKLFLLDSYSNRSQNLQEKVGVKHSEDERKDVVGLTSKVFKNDSKIKKGLVSLTAKSGHKVEKSQREKNLVSMSSSASKINEVVSKEQEEIYFKRERKNINSLFNIFRDLTLDSSVAYAKVVSKGISQRNINFACIPQLRQAFPASEDRMQQQRRLNQNNNALKPLQKARGMLRNLYRQKRVLSYNPYSVPKNSELMQFQKPKKDKVQMPKKEKVQKERKQRLFSHECSKQVYNSKLRCLAIMHFNMQLVLVKVVREYNKIALEQQDKVRVVTENEHKKNQIIQAIDFYYHSIVDRWFLIVLFRVEVKNQFRNDNQSYIRGYEIELVDNKRRNEKDYRFRSRKESFTLRIQHPTVSGPPVTFEIFSMEMQFQYGIHFISVNGRYVCFREDFIESTTLGHQNVYFVFNHEQRFRNANLALSCMSVGVQINKIVFGTIRGILITYDMFSHHFRMKKVANEQIIALKLVGHLCYILTVDEKFIVYDEGKGQELQHLSVKNETKLHEKVKHFQIDSRVIYFYGTEVRSYCEYVDEKLLHERRKMQTIYKWRLDKLFKEEASFKKEGIYRGREIVKLMPTGGVQARSNANIEMIISSESYFLALSEILQLIVLQKKSLKIKFTMILGIPHDSKVMKMALSCNEKLLALLLFNQSIFIFNIHTQDEYQHIKPSPFLRYTSLVFLDLKNQFLLATGTENGKIILAPYSVIPEKSSKVLEHHRQTVTTLMMVKREYLVSCGEDMSIAIWLLPFNILKHEIKLEMQLGFITEQFGSCKQFAYLRTVEGYILQINVHEGKIIHVLKDYLNWSLCAVDPCTNNLLGVTKDLQLQIVSKSKGKWTTQTLFKLQALKSEVKGLGIVESERVVIFVETGLAVPWNYQNEKLGKMINLYQQ